MKTFDSHRTVHRFIKVLAQYQNWICADANNFIWWDIRTICYLSFHTNRCKIYQFLVWLSERNSNCYTFHSLLENYVFWCEGYFFYVFIIADIEVLLVNHCFPVPWWWRVPFFILVTFGLCLMRDLYWMLSWYGTVSMSSFLIFGVQNSHKIGK